jgi:hypothetical protein
MDAACLACTDRRSPVPDVDDAVDAVQSAATTLNRSPVLHALARGGFVVNGVIHILIGAIAVTIAAGGEGSADQGGALGQVASYPFGFVILWVLAAGLAGLGLLQLVEAVLVRGTDREDWAERIKEAAKGVVYFAIGGSAAAYAVGRSPDSGEQAHDFSSALIATLPGRALLVLVGLVALSVGGYFVAKGVRRRFLRDLAVPGGTWTRVATVLGVAGYTSKGVAIAVVGVLFVVAAVTLDASGSTGLDGALKALARLPFGTVVLAVVALGLFAYGVYCFVRARFRA